MSEWTKEIFAKNLRYYLSRSGKTQKEVAKFIGVSAPTFHEWCSAKKTPRMDKIEALANYFGILKSDLIEEHIADERADTEPLSVTDKYEKISERIREAVRNSGFSYAELEKITGFSKSALQRYASGTTNKIPADCIQRIATATNTTPSYLMGWEDMPFVRLSQKEEKVILKYRENPQMQSAVDKLLGIE